MATCPNKNLNEWKSLVTTRGEDVAFYLWDKYDGNVPESENRTEIVKSGLKATNILQSDKADQFFNTVAKNKISGEPFWKKMQADLGIPKDQIEILKSFNTQNRGELIASLLGNYSYTVEINTSKNLGQNRKFIVDDTTGMYVLLYDNGELDRQFKTREELEKFRDGSNSQFYSNLTVPGGANYTENEIATPAITPSIVGHAQFATPNGIGWFRSDDSVVGISNRKALPQELEMIRETEGFAKAKEVEKYGFPDTGGTITKTRRILEVQSDLFQKGRDKKDLIGTKTTSSYGAESLDNAVIKKNNRTGDYYIVIEEDLPGFESYVTKDGEKTATQFKTKEEAQKFIDNSKKPNSSNQFLQLLNQGSNWVTFFVKSIMQDSAKKGYEKVLFPSGETAAKVEGHQTLADQIKDVNDDLTSFKKYVSKPKKERLGLLEQELDKAKEKIKAALPRINEIKKQIKDIYDSAEFLYQEPYYNVEGFDYGRIQNTESPYRKGDHVDKLPPGYSGYYIFAYNTGVNGTTKVIPVSDKEAKEKWKEQGGDPNQDNMQLVLRLRGEMYNLEGYEVTQIEDKIKNEDDTYEYRLKQIPILEKRKNELISEGLSKLKPIEFFYGNTVANVLKKQGYSPEQVKDEYGNTWNEIKIISERETQPILFQLEGAPATVASPEILQKVKEVLKKMGVNIESLAEYAKTSSVNVSGVNALADLVRGVIAVAEGKEDVALTEEMVHIATAILEQKNPSLVTEMISKIDRFKIYKETLEQYKNNKAYQLPNGKPDIRKIKKEAVDKLIAELIINGNTGDGNFPELASEENRSIVRRWWNAITDFFRGMYKSANISIFEETAKQIIEGGVEGQVSDIVEGDVLFQLAEPTKAQKEIQRRILETDQALRKGEIDPETDVLTLGDPDASNFYEYKQPDGTWKIVTKRVTDRVKSYYKDKFRDVIFTKEQKAFNEFKRTLGVKYHGYFEEIHNRFFNKDGTRKSNPDSRPDILDKVDAEVYSKLENYYTNLIESRSRGGKNILVFSEVKVYDPREKEAGTIDLLIVDEDGTGNIFDWKFMSVDEGQRDIQWYKQEAYNIQLGRYRDILFSNYGVKKIGMNRAVPILFQIKPADKKVQGSEPRLTGINVGSVDTSKIEDLKLIPISERTESTGFESLDKFIEELNAVLNRISNRKATSDEEREFKRERLNIVREAIRVAQGTMNIKPVIDVVLVMIKEGENLISEYNVTYKNEDPRSNKFTNKQLSEFSSELRDFIAIAKVFGRIDDKIGKLIYDKDMDISNMSEEEIDDRIELLNDVREKSRNIRDDEKKVFEIAGEFADKYMGLRNLVSGLLNPEAVVKGLGSFFRTVSEIPLASVQILYKLTENAKTKASADAKDEVDELMGIRKKLAARGGDLRALVKKIYRRDEKGNIVNKLIYKYSPEFEEGVKNNALEENRNKQWLKDNIDVEAYSKEANELLQKRINQLNKDYANNEELRDRLIIQERQKWDIKRPDFNGWTNYIIMRHPLPKWLSEEYKELEKDQDLLDLYNFITNINDKANNAGYLTNQGISTFLPWVRKSMAESLAWDFSLSTVMNFGNKLSLRADDVGWGSIDALTNEVENAIPKYYTTDFTRLPGGEVDTSEVSEDLFANMVLYIGHMNNYKYLSEVEGQIQIIKDLETFKKHHLQTSKNGDVVIKNGVAEKSEGNEENAKIYDQFMRAVLYDQKYALDDTDVTISTGVTDYMKKAVNKTAKHFGGKEIFTTSDEPSSISLVKTMETMNRYFQLKALGLEFVSGAVNWFGTNVQLAAQSGTYFTRGEVMSKQYKILNNKLDKNQQNLFVELINTFMPLREDPNYESFKKAGMSVLTQKDFGDILMFFMRQPEQFTEKAVFMTLLDNVMVQNGRFENIRKIVKSKYDKEMSTASAFRIKEINKLIESEVEQLKKEKSVSSTMKIEDGKLVIPGFDLNNRDEIQRLTKLTRGISTNATGGINSANVNRAQMNIWFKSAMVFKSWIPGLAFTRFDHLRKISDDFSVTINEDGTTEGERYDIGRLRLFAYVIGTSAVQQSNNILNIIQLNEKGVIELDRMFEKFSDDYFKQTGQTLNMTRAEFIDLMRTNLRNQLNEFAITLSLIGLAFSMGMIAPDDDEDRATKNLFRYGQRVVDKFVSELTFFINPVEFQGILEGNLIPAIGVVTDATRFVNHFTRQVTGFDVSNPEKSFEDVQKDAQPIKNLAKMFPVSKSLINYLAMFDEEFAKEYDITIPKTTPK